MTKAKDKELDNFKNLCSRLTEAELKNFLSEIKQELEEDRLERQKWQREIDAQIKAKAGQGIKLATGGVVRRATSAIIGEDGAEAVMPLEKNTGWIDRLASRLNGGKGGIIINQTNNYSQAHSRYELYKSQQATAKAVKLALTR